MLVIPLLALRGVLGAAPLVVLPFQGAPAHAQVLTTFTRTYATALSDNQVPVIVASDSPAAIACATEHRCDPPPVPGLAVSGYVSAKLEETAKGEVHFSIDARKPSGEVLGSDSGSAADESAALEAMRSSADRLSTVLLAQVPNESKRVRSYRLASQLTFWGGLGAMAGGGLLFYLAHDKGSQLAIQDPTRPPVTLDEAFSIDSSQRTEKTLGAVALGVGVTAWAASYWCWHQSRAASQPYVAAVQGGAVVGWAGVLP